MILIVHDDLQNETGWARATRALLDVISSEFSAVIGADLHYHPNRSNVFSVKLDFKIDIDWLESNDNR